MNKRNTFLEFSLFLSSLLFMGSWLTSCDGNDDSSQLSAADKKAAYEAVKGDYNGFMIYTAPGTSASSNQNVTVSMSWNISGDTLLTIKDFRPYFLAQNIEDSALKNALDTLPAHDLTCSITYTSLSPVWFLIKPTSPTYNVTYGGASHEVRVAFYVNSTASYGRQDEKTNKLLLKITESLIYVDGVSTTALKHSSPLIFYTD